MTTLESESENYSDRFFDTIFEDKHDRDYDITIMVGDFNVAPDHNKDTLGYLHVNNPNTRRFIDRMKSLNMMTDVYRHKHQTSDSSYPTRNKHASRTWLDCAWPQP